ncbi:Hypothetical protein D9617_22g066200 [Elsinoe fawcettii]|nr:Hypothetical protein D9617_22g066200 [Elsinoe fawcettii]
MLVTTTRGGAWALLLLLIPIIWFTVGHFPTLLTFDTSESRQQVGDQPAPVKEKWRDQKASSDSPHAHPPWVEPAPIAVSDGLSTTITTPSTPAEAPLDAPKQKEYHTIKSQTSIDGRYFEIDFKYSAINPNIIPHPTEPETYIIVAQKHKYGVQGSFFFVELVCNAVFSNGILKCSEPPSILPIAATSSGDCSGKYDFFSLSVGPHDARVFWGPDRPYVLFGSNSQRNCFGQWIQDLRMLIPWHEPANLLLPYRFATDLQKPPPYSPIEKNWFLFWDSDDRIYVHYDVSPHRSFAQLSPDGSVGDDLALYRRPSDDECFARHGPKAQGEGESIHQATNSLAITMCRRADPGCERKAENTFIFTIFHTKHHENLHSVYEPYVMLFQQNSPFATHALGSKPLWIHGRKKAGEDTVMQGQSEMMYVTSMNWKANGTRYAGFLDDVVMLGFGIEDRRTAGIDVLAEDLVGELALC